MLRQVRPLASGLVLSLVALLSLPLAGPAAAADADVLGGPGLAGYGVRVDLGAGARPLPAVSAESWVLADLTTGEILAAKGAHRRGRPASTLKTLTAVTLMPVLDKKATHKVSWKEASAEGGRVGIVPDATYTNWDLWHGLLLPSGNDAAAALADSHGGMKKTVADMQARAVSLQARDTTVRNASGLDADGQLTSAYDLALIARAAMQIEDFRTVTSTVSYDFPGRTQKNGKRTSYKIYTQNRLLLHGFDGAVAGKTGYTTLAGRTFWGAAERNGHVLVVTLLQVHERTEQAAKDLLTWGFANRTKVTPVGVLVDPLPEGGEAVAPSPSATTAGAIEPASAGGASSAPARSTAGLSPWLVAGVVLVAVVGGLLWWRRSRAGSPSRATGALTERGVPDLTTATPPGATPPAARPTPSVTVAARPVAAEPAPPAEAAGTTPVVDVPPPAKPAPATGGNVRIVRQPPRGQSPE